jgi:hypothetical protein
MTDPTSRQSSWLYIQRSWFDSQRHQIFWEVVVLERGPLSLVSTNEELLERKSSGSGLENREYGCRDPSRWPRGTLYLLKLALTSLTGGGRKVGIVRSCTQVTWCFYARRDWVKPQAKLVTTENRTWDLKIRIMGNNSWRGEEESCPEHELSKFHLPTSFTSNPTSLDGVVFR